MNTKNEELILRFVKGKRLSDTETELHEKILQNKDSANKLNVWMKEKWEVSEPETVNTSFEQIRELTDKRRTISYKKKTFFRLSGIAAILAIPLLITTLVLHKRDISGAGFNTLTTQKGDRVNVILPDGSKVWMNADTKLSYPIDFGVRSRDIIIDGEAYFEVAKNKDLPFIVTSGPLKTRAIGTAFAISAYPGDSEYRSSLVEGKVEVSYKSPDNKNISEILTPGMQLQYDVNDGKAVVQSFQTEQELAWKDYLLVFRFTPFNEVMTKLERWYDVEIEYDNNSFKNETLTVRFEKYESLEKVLKVVSSAVGCEYTVENNNITLTR